MISKKKKKSRTLNKDLIWVHAVYLENDSKKACEDGTVRREEQEKILRPVEVNGLML